MKSPFPCKNELMAGAESPCPGLRDPELDRMTSQKATDTPPSPVKDPVLKSSCQWPFFGAQLVFVKSSCSSIGRDFPFQLQLLPNNIPGFNMSKPDSTTFTSTSFPHIPNNCLYQHFPGNNSREPSLRQRHIKAFYACKSLGLSYCGGYV